MRHIFVMSHSATAPEKMRTVVNVAGSIPVCFKARRQSSELLANATIASDVSRKMRDLVTLLPDIPRDERRRPASLEFHRGLLSRDADVIAAGFRTSTNLTSAHCADEQRFFGKAQWY